MDSTERDALAELSAMAERAQKALQERPGFSIRARIIVGFAAWFLLSVGLAAASVLTLSRIEDKLDFTVAADRYTFEIQQARRYEKNYFLYRTNLAEVFDHVDTAEGILNREEANIRGVIGGADLQEMVDHLHEYRRLLTGLREMDRLEAPWGLPEYEEIEAGLREHGSEMVTVAEILVDRERQAAEAMLRISQRIPLGFLAVLLLLITYLVYFISQQMLAPLSRMMKTAERVANGDFTPITPVRKYHDEFSHLAVAVNHMLIQLAHRQELLVHAHKLKAVGTLTAGVAHELNNPINNIMLTAASLQDDYAELDEEERMEMVNDLVGESERAQRIVRNLLDFARESKIETSAIQPRRLVEETLQLATNQIKLAKVKVKGEVEENLPILHGDFQQLVQVFLNLVLNALDAMPGGGALTIAITCGRGDDFVRFRFTDTGTGIPDHVLPNIFDPFFTTKPGARGTGLGLSVSLGIVQAHGGDIKVESELGQGTTFTVLLPVAKVPAAMANGSPEGAWDEDEEEIPA